MPVFDAFFKIESFNIVPQDYDIERPIFRGIFEDNDPKKRLMAIINFNTDVSNFWEFSATGLKLNVLGDVTFAVGGPVLGVKDLKTLRASCS